ncbi:hypothetical protein AMATHDRAFT_7278 [Amanita thiersii Skay4041]|uniref:Dynein heavy chain tail domain-containing protein n=1 Tax=Amanita thiersii Skay4041 TaxID=703135 RepID=A0A2A9N881_9AGAR|nr:hypothetical protein AMATHDRAFT_7278 [Amanita thiersii Skay4041]
MATGSVDKQYFTSYRKTSPPNTLRKAHTRHSSGSAGRVGLNLVGRLLGTSGNNSRTSISSVLGFSRTASVDSNNPGQSTTRSSLESKSLQTKETLIFSTPTDTTTSHSHLDSHVDNDNTLNTTNTTLPKPSTSSQPSPNATTTTNNTDTDLPLLSESTNSIPNHVHASDLDVVTGASEKGESTASPAPTPPQPPFDAEVFRAYLKTLLPPVLAVDQTDLESLFNSEFDEYMAGFASETDNVMYVTKVKEDSEDDSQPIYRYRLTTRLSYHSANIMTLALIKRGPTLDTTVPLSSQVHMLTFFGGQETPYKSLHAVVSCGVKPWFDTFVGAQGGGKEVLDTKMGILFAKKKFTELELSLLHLQQNVEIPETHLVIHPVIQKVVEQARNSGTHPNLSYIPSKLLNDSTFLNTLHAHVNSWIKSIQSITKLSRDIASGTASQEINFWLSLERALDVIEVQLRSEEVSMVMDCLRNAKRFRATVSFIADTGLQSAAERVHKYNQIMRDFPLDELLSAPDLEKIQESVVLIFGHLIRKLKLSPYPISRALLLVEAISRDFNNQLLRILISHRLLYKPYDTFDRLLAQTMNVFGIWEENLKEFKSVARELMRKRQERFTPIKVSLAYAKLQERVRYLREWRRQHEQLAVMTKPMKGLGVMDIEEEVKEAYGVMKAIDILDVSLEGTEIWVVAENAYNERMSRVENQITIRLRDRLGAARNANEIFRVFSKFNALFVRPKIRGAVQEYQTQLISSVKEDINRLHDKFKTQYRHSEVYHMAQMRDLPPIAGAIIWARQIEHQLLTYMKRVEDVLGQGWELYAEGQKLQSESNAFKKKLDTRPVYEAWLTDINRRNLSIDGRLFEITRLPGGSFQLAVNFDPQMITLFKEVRNLLWLGFKVHHATANMAKDAKRVYPHAVRLIETVKTYRKVLSLVEQNKGIEWLVAEYRTESQKMIAKGMNIRWDHFMNQHDISRYVSGSDAKDDRNVQFVLEFASVVSFFQDKTNNAIGLYQGITRAVEDLATCPYTTEAFSELLARIQLAIDRLNLEGYANLDHWVAELDKRIESVLVQRLMQCIQAWCHEFDCMDGTDIRRDTSLLKGITNRRQDNRAREERFMETRMTVKPIIHEIRIQNQVIFLDPPIEYARVILIRQLHDWLGVVCRQKRIQSSRYEIGLQMQKVPASETTYTSLLTKLPDNILERPFMLVEFKVQQLKDYTAKWLQFQSLWDLQAEYVFNRLGNSLALWQQLLTEIKKSRSTFDTSDTRKSFGVCVVDYEQVQARVNAKYDAWEREILSRFSVRLGSVMKEVHAAVSIARNELEHQSIDGSVSGRSRRF